MPIQPTAPTPTPSAPPAEPRRGAAPGTTHAEEAHTPIAALADWAKGEWSTVAATAHGFAAAPGVTAKHLKEAADDNRDIADAVGKLRSMWTKQSPDVRNAAIRQLESHARAIPHGTELVHTLDMANAASRGTSPAAPLPRDVVKTIKKDVRTLNRVANRQAAQASKPLGNIARIIAADVGDVAKAGGFESALRGTPALRSVPIVGAGIAVAGVVDDIKNRHVDPTTAVVAGGASLVGGAIAGDLAATAVAGAAAAAGVGVGVAAAPVVAVVAGVVVAGAAGYGIYKAVESQGGQDLIGGAAHGDLHRMQQGAHEAARDLRGIGEGIVKATVHGAVSLGPI